MSWPPAQLPRRCACRHSSGGPPNGDRIGELFDLAIDEPNVPRFAEEALDVKIERSVVAPV
jgi:hypothetical protein